MKIVDIETYAVGAGWKNWLFVRVITDTGLHGIGEGTLNGFIKTTEALFEDVAELVSQLHTYEVPEIMAFKADFTKNNVLKWLYDSVRLR